MSRRSQYHTASNDPRSTRHSKRNSATGEFQSRNLKAVDPKKEQFAPTDGAPVNQHKRMAGDC